ncbi:hypothetical protein Btru_040139 [Bulinus truncatus]|nr:hypothetical protein Btru_040139 [Bulinus truncatus]
MELLDNTRAPIQGDHVKLPTQTLPPIKQVNSAAKMKVKIINQKAAKSENIKFPAKSLVPIYPGLKILKCDSCPKSFLNEDLYNKHQKTHSVFKPFSCDKCTKTFSKEIYLKNHQFVHSEDRPFVCPDCNKSFAKFSSLKDHKLTHGKERPFECLICNKAFLKRNYLNQHNMIHTGEKPYICDICSKSFFKLSHLKRHQLSHTRQKPFACVICNRFFSCLDKLNQHIQIHMNGKPKKNLTKEERKLHLCVLCNKSFLSLAGVKSHLLRHYENKNLNPSGSMSSKSQTTVNTNAMYSCYRCCVPFPSWSDLNLHLSKLECNFMDFMDFKNQIDDPDPINGLYGHDYGVTPENSFQVKVENQVKSFKCEHCEKCFPNRRRYRRHVKSHTGDKPFKCDVCQKMFSSEYNLKSHKIVHNEVKPFRCDMCNKTFAKFSSIKEHQVIHCGEKTFMCDLCGKAFLKKNYLNQHRLIHTGLKSYVCEFCSKSFYKISHLKRHFMVHTGEKPYPCDVCNKFFSSRSSLKEHQWGAHNMTDTKNSILQSRVLAKHSVLLESGVKAYDCKICNKRFSKSYGLKRHLLIHTGQKPFQYDPRSAAPLSNLGIAEGLGPLHLTKDVFHCAHCSRNFTSEGRLEKHLALHGSGGSGFSCEICNKVFTKMSNLRDHRFEHKGEKPYKCDLCPKSFIRSNHLKEHKHIHSDRLKKKTNEFYLFSTAVLVTQHPQKNTEKKKENSGHH